MRVEKWLIGTLSVGVIAAGLLAWQESRNGVAHTAMIARPAVPQAPAPEPAARPNVIPAPPTEPGLTEQIDRLMATRDAANALRAYRLLADCATFNIEHDRLVFDAAEIKNWKGDTLPGYRGMNEGEKLHDAKLCGGMTERQRQSRLDYLAIAAKAGTPGAAQAFVEEGPFGDRTALTSRPNDPLVLEWKALAIAQLTSAADGGEEMAMHFLANVSVNGNEVIEKNPGLAYRYFSALGLVYRERFGADQALSKAYADDGAMLTAIAANLSPQERAFELAAARRLADNARELRKRADEKR
jgi:hypothetical protein